MLLTFGDGSKFYQSPASTPLGCLHPNLLSPFVIHADVGSICARLQPSFAVSRLQIEIVSACSSAQWSRMVLTNSGPVPRTNCDNTSVAFLNLRMGHVGAEVRTVGFHDIYLVVQVLKGSRAIIVSALRELCRGQAEEDEGVIAALLRTKRQEKSRMSCQLREW